MLQKLGRIKFGHFFEPTCAHARWALRRRLLSVRLSVRPSVRLSVCPSVMQVNWSTSTSHFLVEYVMAVRMTLSLLKLAPNSIKYSKLRIGKSKCAHY